MNKIKQLETWVLSKDWIYNKLDSLANAIKAALDRHKYDYYLRYIEKTVDEMGPTKVGKSTLKIFAKNALTSQFATDGNTGKPFSPKFIIDLTLKVSDVLANEVGALVGFQSMAGPVGQVYSMQYKTVENENPDTAELSSIRTDGGRRLTLEIVSNAIGAETKRLNSAFSMEAASDMLAVHKINLEDELLRAYTSEVSYEILNEVIGTLVKNAEHSTISLKTKVDSTKKIKKPKKAVENFPSSAFVGDKFSKIGIAINERCNEIGRTTRRGVGNFIVVSPVIVSMLQTASNTVFAPAIEGSYKGPNNFQFVGTLNGSIKVYCALVTALESDSILIGYKGANEVDTGYVYAPYVTVSVGPTTIHPITFSPLRPLFNRAGKILLDASYYKVLKIEDIDFS
jgi:hypothetical protein